MRKGRDGENGGEMKENNGENSGPLTSLPVDRLTATDCNAAARANLYAFNDSNTSCLRDHFHNV